MSIRRKSFEHTEGHTNLVSGMGVTTSPQPAPHSHNCYKQGGLFSGRPISDARDVHNAPSPGSRQIQKCLHASKDTRLPSLSLSLSYTEYP